METVSGTSRNFSQEFEPNQNFDRFSCCIRYYRTCFKFLIKHEALIEWRVWYEKLCIKFCLHLNNSYNWLMIDSIALNIERLQLHHFANTTKKTTFMKLKISIITNFQSNMNLTNSSNSSRLALTPSKEYFIG